MAFFGTFTQNTTVCDEYSDSPGSAALAYRLPSNRTAPCQRPAVCVTGTVPLEIFNCMSELLTGWPDDSALKSAPSVSSKDQCMQSVFRLKWSSTSGWVSSANFCPASSAAETPDDSKRLDSFAVSRMGCRLAAELDSASTLPLSTSTSAAPPASALMVNSVPRSTISTFGLEMLKPTASGGTCALSVPRFSVAAHADFTSSDAGP